MHIKLSGVFICALLAVYCAAPTGASTQSQTAGVVANKIFVIPKNADNVRTQAGGNVVAFELAEPYPAERFRLALENAFLAPQWRKEDELKLFPGRKTSESPGGWFRYIEGGQMVYMLAVNWLDKDDNSVTYVVRYRFPEKEMPTGGSAEVEAVFKPSK